MHSHSDCLLPLNKYCTEAKFNLKRCVLELKNTRIQYIELHWIPINVGLRICAIRPCLKETTATAECVWSLDAANSTVKASAWFKSICSVMPFKEFGTMSQSGMTSSSALSGAHILHGSSLLLIICLLLSLFLVPPPFPLSSPVPICEAIKSSYGEILVIQEGRAKKVTERVRKMDEA